MKIVKINVIGLLFAGLHYYVHAGQKNILQSLENETKEKISASSSHMPQVYTLTLPNGQSLDFDEKILEQADFFKPLIRGNDRTIPITHAITKLHTNNSDEMSLFEFHKLLSSLATCPKSSQALDKLISSLYVCSFDTLIYLLPIAVYFEIEPLIQHITKILSHEFAHNTSNAAYRKAVEGLPYDWQAEITSLVVMQNKIIRNFLKKMVKPAHIIMTQRAPLLTMALSPDKTKLASGSADGIIHLWTCENEEWQLLRQMNTGSGVNALAWAPDCIKLVAGLHNNESIICESKTGTIVRRMREHEDAVFSVAWSPDGTQIASGSLDESVIIWRENGNIVNKLFKKHKIPASKYPVVTIEWSPNGKFFAFDDYHSIEVFTAEDEWKLLPDICVKNNALFSNTLTHFTWMPDSQRIVSSQSTPIAYKVHTETGWKLKSAPLGLQRYKNSFVCDVKITNMKATKNKNIVIGNHLDVRSIAASPDGKQLAFGFWDGAVSIWDVAENQIVYTFLHGDVVNSVAWLSNNQIVSASSDGTIKIWSLYPELLQLSLPQIDLLERIIKAKKIILSPADVPTYATLTKNWKDLLSLAGYGAPALLPSQAGLFSTAYKYLMGNK